VAKQVHFHMVVLAFKQLLYQVPTIAAQHEDNNQHALSAPNPINMSQEPSGG
jgi:hypothetical protein